RQVEVRIPMRTALLLPLPALLGCVFAAPPPVTVDVNAPPDALEAACARGDAPSCEELGLRVENGKMTSPVSAFGWYQKGCALGHASSCADAGWLLQNGKAGAPLDPAAARALHEKTCQQGIGRACTNLGLLVENGEGGPKDLPRALTLYEM